MEIYFLLLFFFGNEILDDFVSPRTFSFRLISARNKFKLISLSYGSEGVCIGNMF